jgi:hypothetical protein
MHDRHNSVRVFFDRCSLCDGLLICEGFWYPELSDPSRDYEGGILSIEATCLKCGQESSTTKPPGYVGGLPKPLEELTQVKSRGIPYSAMISSIVPDGFEIDIILHNRQQ